MNKSRVIIIKLYSKIKKINDSYPPLL
jgi:hypothetical protein